ncbi:MAG: HAMP domain-containing histidine kinase [Eubacterium sp.]|nr:HAMP domain-containing histidine kinase [Eubacterium sp.]
MKSITKVIITFTSIMIVGLGAMLLMYRRISLSTKAVCSYSDGEIEIYKKIWSNLNENFELGQQQMLECMIIFWFIILAAGYIFIGLVYYFQVRPVREMQNFASEIAKGNLDTALPIHRDNLFGSFTESFDIMREELKASKQRELAAEHAKRELVAELSHDLKTPVATIQATCEVLDMRFQKNRQDLEKQKNELLNGSSDDEAREESLRQIDSELEENGSLLEKIGFISNKSETINSLVQNVFRATLDDMEEISINSVENDSRIIENYFKGLKDYGNIILENHIPECLVYMDKLRMEQVIDNIVGNSYKYAGTDIYVSFEELNNVPSNKDSTDSFIKIRIKDQGPGVPEEELALVVEKYYRGSDVQDKNGYGLGMYLVNWYMEKQGGGMEYYNDEGFVVELLVKKV